MTLWATPAHDKTEKEMFPFRSSCGTRVFAATGMVGCPVLRWASTSVGGASSWTKNSAAQRADPAYMYSLQVYHKKLFPNPKERTKCKNLEREAWRQLQQLRDEDVDAASAEHLAELLTCWVYFSKFWENGMNGPGSTGPEQRGASEMAAVNVPLVRRDNTPQPRKPMPPAEALPPRSNPLDEILDF